MTLELDIAHAMSLKDKRAVLNRIKDRVRGKFNVSIAEIEDHEIWNTAVLGIVVVSNDQKYCNQVLSKVEEHVEAIKDCEIDEVTTSFMRV
jgi:uncharacterized protein YlxP (DUF503 family)